MGIEDCVNVGDALGEYVGWTDMYMVGCIGVFDGRKVGRLVGTFVGLRVGELVHNRLQTLLLHCASGLQQSLSVVHPYPVVVGKQLFPVFGFTVETKYCDFSWQDVYVPTTAQYNPGQQSRSRRQAGSKLHRQGKVSIVGGAVSGNVGTTVWTGVGFSVGVDVKQTEGTNDVGTDEAGSKVG